MPNKIEILSIRQIIDKYNSKNDFTPPAEVVTDNNKLHMKGIAIVPNSVRNIIARFEAGQTLSEPIQRKSNYSTINSNNRKDKIDPEIVKSRIQHFSKVNEISSINYTNDYKPKVFKELLPTSKRTDFTSLRGQFESYQSDYQDDTWWEELTSSELNFSQTSCSPSDIDLRSTREGYLNELRTTTKSIINSFGIENNHVNGYTNIASAKANYTNSLYTTEDPVVIGYQYLLRRFISDLGISIPENLNNWNGNQLARIKDSTGNSSTPYRNDTESPAFEESVFVLKTTHLNQAYADNVFIESLESTNSQRSTNSETESKSDYQYFNHLTGYRESSRMNKDMPNEKTETDIELPIRTHDIDGTPSKENSLERKKTLSEQESQTDYEQYTETFNSLLKQIQYEVHNYSSLKNRENLIEQETQTDFDSNNSAKQSKKEDNDNFSVKGIVNQARNEEKLFEKDPEGKSINFINNSLFKQKAESFEQETAIDLEQYADEFENLVTQIQKGDDEDFLESDETLFEEDTETDLQQYVDVFDSLVQKAQYHDNYISLARNNDQLLERTTEDLQKYGHGHDTVDGQTKDDSTAKNIFSTTQNVKADQYTAGSSCSTKYSEHKVRSVDYLEEVKKITESETSLNQNIKRTQNDIDSIDVLDENQKLFEQNSEADFEQYERVFDALAEKSLQEIDNVEGDETLFEDTIEVGSEFTIAFDNLLKHEKNTNINKEKVQLFYKITNCDLKDSTSICNSSTDQNECLQEKAPNFNAIERESEINSGKSVKDFQSLKRQIKNKDDILEFPLETGQLEKTTVINLEQCSNRLTKRTQNNEIHEDFASEHQNIPEQDSAKDLPNKKLEERKFDNLVQQMKMEKVNVLANNIIKFQEKTQEEFKYPDLVEPAPNKTHTEELLGGNKTSTLSETKIGLTGNVDRSSNILDQSQMHKSKNIIKNLQTENLEGSIGRRWSAGNADLLKSRSKLKKSLKEGSSDTEPRRSSVVDIIEQFNNKSILTTTKSVENLRLNSTRFRIRRGSSGNTKLSTSDKAEEFFTEKSDLDSEKIKLQVGVEKLTNIFEKRIAENRVTSGIYPKIDALREKLEHNKKINYAPKILDDVMEVIEEVNVTSNEKTKHIFDVKRRIEETYTDEFDPGNFPNSQAECQTDQRNVQNPRQQEDLVVFYNGFFEKISSPVFVVMSVYCAFCLIIEISAFLFYIFTLPFCW